MKYYIFSEIYLILMVNNATHICHNKTLGAMMIEGLKSHLDKMGVDCDGLRHNQNNS